MRLLIGIIVALFISVGIALLLREDPGYVLMYIGDYIVETSVAALVVFTLLLLLLFYFLIRLLVRLWRMPRDTKEAVRRRRRRRALNFFIRGMRELAEGRWAAAEASLTKGVDSSPMPVLHYLGAARAAQRQDAAWRRDSYLRKADELPRDDTLVVGLTKAELYLEDNEPAKARPVLLQLRTLFKRHPRVLELLVQCYQSLGEWDRAQDLLPELRKRKALDETRLSTLQTEIYRERLAAIASTGNVAELRDYWRSLPPVLRGDEAMLIAYAGYLRDNNAADEAEVLLREALRQQWSDKLVIGYGEIGRGDAASQLTVAEGWLEQHPDNPHLLLTLGRLAKRSRQLEKARAYLERSIRVMPNPDAYNELGEVLELMNDEASAKLAYRAGLRLLSGRPEEKEGVPMLPAAEVTDKALPAADLPPPETRPLTT